jgi:ketosteroid isomerase-like protein
MLDTTVNDIRTMIERWAMSVQRCDLDGVLAHHGDDVVMFDVPPPEKGVRGLSEYTATWPAFFDWVRTGARFEIDELQVEVGGDVAFAWGLLRCGTDDELTRDPGRRLRLSLGLRKRSGSWEIVHEHHSFTQQ